MVAQVADVIFESEVSRIPLQTHKTIAITGCTSGTGYWLAHTAVVKQAALVLMLNRCSERSERAEARLKELADQVGSSSIIRTIPCDLMDMGSVRRAAEQVREAVESYGGLDILANNAGIMMFPDERTVDGFDVQMQTNHLSHFLLTKHVLPCLQDAVNSRGEARVVQHSSGARHFKRGSTKGSDGSLEGIYFEKCAPQTLGGDGSNACVARYHMTKLANAVFAMSLHDKLQRQGISGIKSIAVEPGIASTELLNNLNAGHSEAGVFSFARLLSWLSPIQHFFASYYMQSAADGACPLIRACFAEEIDSQDLLMPRNGRYGVPTKLIIKGKPKAGKGERRTLDPAGHHLLWEKSEEAIQEKFLAKL